MRRFLGALAALVLAIGGAGQVRAGQVNILYYTDTPLGTNEMAAALAALPAGYTVTTVNTPLAFQTAISTPGAYQLGIYSNQQGFDGSPGFTGPPNDTSALAALATFVQGGGKAIVNTDVNFGIITTAPYQPFGADFDNGGTVPPPNNPVNISLSQFTNGLGGPLSSVTITPNPSYAYSGLHLTLDPSTGISTAGTWPATVGDDAIETGKPTGTSNGGSDIVNGFAEDVGGSGAQALYENEIGNLAPLSNGSVPEPATLTVLGFGVAGMFGYARLRRKKRVAAA